MEVPELEPRGVNRTGQKRTATVALGPMSCVAGLSGKERMSITNIKEHKKSISGIKTQNSLAH